MTASTNEVVSPMRAHPLRTVTPSRHPALLLETMYGDSVMSEVFSERATIQAWLSVEAALARAQALAGVLDNETAEAITTAADADNIDVNLLWSESRNVGYPILPLVRQLAAALPHGANGAVHYGATTQDIMDTGLALQLRDAADRLAELIAVLGDALAALVAQHRETIMAGRTHGQQAVPTTFGAKLATFLAEFTRHRDRLSQLRPRLCLVSLHGAAGTSAAFGPTAADVRRSVAHDLGLDDSPVPWHVARDGLAEFGWVCAAAAATCARLAGEVVALSRTEVGEVGEADGHHRGASSTMPQKANPILSEMVIGFAGTAAAMSGALFQAMRAGHERSAGEWQVEWQVLPQLACLGASALACTITLVEGLRVFGDRMRANLDADNGLIMAEAYMMQLAPMLGREQAHDLVYEACRKARATESTLRDVMRMVVTSAGLPASAATEVRPDGYLGLARAVCDEAIRVWSPALGVTSKPA